MALPINDNTRDREVWNHLRIDLYRRLLPKIQEKDQESGAQGFTVHWDDPDPFWDTGDPLVAWDAIGATPLIKELFFVIETMMGEDIQALESMDALVDPLRCPKQLLPDIAASFGYGLAQGISEDAQRTVLLGLINAYKSRGTFAGFKVFYRLLGFDILRVIPLWKKDINEANNDYSTVRYSTEIKTQTIGASGLAFAGTLPDAPIKPGTFRVAISGGSVVMRDVPPDSALVHVGQLIGPGMESGTINYITGDYNIAIPVAGVPTATWEHVTEEWPYHAARIDIEINLSPGGGPPPLVDPEVVAGVLNRLEETRPIHVLLRTLALIIDQRDTVTPTATDKQSCIVQQDDRRSDSVREYIIEAAPTGDDVMVVDHFNAISMTPVKETNLEDHTMGACPLDALKIETIPGATTWW